MTSPKTYKKIEKKIAPLWEYLKAKYDSLDSTVLAMTNTFPELFLSFEQDPDRRNKKEVYLHLAQWICQNSNASLPLALGMVHQLCNEHDPQILRDSIPCPEAALSAVKQDLVAFDVAYLIGKSVIRTTTITYLDQNALKAKVIKEQINYESVPQVVREHRVRTGEQSVKFTLYNMGKE